MSRSWFVMGRHLVHPGMTPAVASAVSIQNQKLAFLNVADTKWIGTTHGIQ